MARRFPFAPLEDSPGGGRRVALDFQQDIPRASLAESFSDELVTSATIDSVVVLTQAAYDALDPKVATTLYVISG